MAIHICTISLTNAIGNHILQGYLLRDPPGAGRRLQRGIAQVVGVSFQSFEDGAAPEFARTRADEVGIPGRARLAVVEDANPPVRWNRIPRDVRVDATRSTVQRRSASFMARDAR